MEGTIRILKRYVSATMIISVFLLIFNFIMLGILVFNGINKGQSPGAVVKNVAESLHKSSNTYELESSAIKMLHQNDAWAMLINEQGQVEWNYMLPAEIPKTYTLAEVSKFTRHFLMDYPVFVWEYGDGVLVVGYPKDSLVKYMYIVPTDWASSFPQRLFALLVGNIVLALLLSLLIGTKLIRSIRPITQGIQSLAEDQSVYIEPKGLLADLAESVNRVSNLLQKKSARLKMRDEARSNWIAGISHDIRTPLSMILGHASDIEENGAVPVEQRRQASIIRKQAEKLKSLVSDLNLVSLLEYEMQPLEKKTIRLSSLARQITAEFLNNGLDERFFLEIEPLDETAKVIGDERLLTRAFHNLIQNSIDHNLNGCEIKIRTIYNDRNNTCSFIVEDNGKGVSPEELPDLLELPYSRKRKYQRKNGHGLGLPMVARIAKAHQGDLLLHSDIGQGFRAEVILPAIKTDK